MTLSLRFAARSDVGLLRDGNEDSGYAGQRLLAVGDGLGGQAAGEVASSVVVATVAPLDDDVPGGELLEALAEAVERANDQLRVLMEQHPQLEGMGTTLTAMLWADGRFGMCHVGDSRAYLLREGRLEQITHDHTWVQQLVDEGRISLEEADHHPQRSLLMRAIDGRGSVELDLSIREARVGDRYLLCSDGLSGVVSRETMEATLLRGGPEQAADALVQLALRGGGPDNITCIVADVVNEADEGLPTTTPQVVGAAADPRSRENLAQPASSPQQTSAATRAAAALQPAGADQSEVEEEPAPRRRGGAAKSALPLLLAVALLGGGGYAGYHWTQQQYYVGVDGEQVAVFQGISQDLAGWPLSHVVQRTGIKVSLLPGLQREAVQATVTAKDLADATKIVNDLRGQAEKCRRIREGSAAKPPTTTGTSSTTTTATAAKSEQLPPGEDGGIAAQFATATASPSSPGEESPDPQVQAACLGG